MSETRWTDAADAKVLGRALGRAAFAPLFARVATSAQVVEAEARVDALARQMTTEEKVDSLGGMGFAMRALPRLGCLRWRASGKVAQVYATLAGSR